MEEFTINGTRNMDLVLPTSQLVDPATYQLAGSQVAIYYTDYVNCIFQYLNTGKHSLWVSEYQAKENATLYGGVSHRLIELQLMLGDGMNHNSYGFGQIETPSCSLNLYHQPYVENKGYFQKGRKIITFDVHLTPEELQEMVSVLPGLDPFLQKIGQEKFAALQDKAIPASPDLLLNIHSILQTPSRPELQSRIIQPQIDALVFNALCYLTQSRPAPIKADEKDRKIIRDVLEHLKTEIDNPMTIKQLSKTYAMNQQKLKALFKEQYGITIHQFTIRERMERACLMLKKANSSIQDIAFSVGYKTAGAFSEKFKATFFMSPLQYRKTMK